MKPKGLGISRFVKTQLFITLGVLYATGIIWLILHYLLVTESEYVAIQSPLEPLVMVIHGSMVPFFLMVVGALFPLHIERAWKSKKNIITGIIVLTVIAVLIGSGCLLYYCGNETLRKFSSLSHSIIGALVVPVFIAHIYFGKKSLIKE